jgi:hypothetical protein
MPTEFLKIQQKDLSMPKRLSQTALAVADFCIAALVGGGAFTVEKNRSAEICK